MHFIDGLKPEIKSVVLMQRPKNLDTTCTLALLQEEVGIPVVSKPPRTGDWSSRSSAPSKYSMSSPPQPDRTQAATVPGDSSVPFVNDSKLGGEILSACYGLMLQVRRQMEQRPQVSTRNTVGRG
jgi:hypothetical protein